MTKTEQLPPVGSVELVVDSASVYPDDKISGTVTVSLDKPLHDAMVTVHVSGEQRLEGVVVTDWFDDRYKERTFQHLDEEICLGTPNERLAAGVGTYPFKIALPADPIANAAFRDISRKFIYDMRSVFMSIKYTVTAKVESAGLSNAALTKQQPFTVMDAPLTALVSPIHVTATEEVTVLGVGTKRPCTLRVTGAKDVFDLPSDVVEVAVEIDVPPHRKLHRVVLVLYEHVDVDRRDDKDGRYREDERVVCSETFGAKWFSCLDGSEGIVLATLRLPIEDTQIQAVGKIVASMASHFLTFRHRLGVEASFVLGSHAVKVSVPVTLVKSVVPVAAAPRG